MTDSGFVIRIYVPICIGIKNDTGIALELSSRLRSLTFCLGNIGRIKEKTNLFRKEMT